VLLTGQVFADVTGEADEETLPSGQHRFWEFVYIEQGKGMGGAMFGTEAACKERHTEASEDPSIVLLSECRSIILAPPKREN
jgi:hypothetical protein